MYSESKKLVCLIVVATFVFIGLPLSSMAEPPPDSAMASTLPSRDYARTSATATDIVADFFLFRPALLVGTVLGVAGKGEKLEVVPRLLITGRRVQGGSFGGARGRTHVPQLVDMYLDGKIDLDGLVSHRMPLERVNDAFELMENHDGVRSVIEFD